MHRIFSIAFIAILLSAASPSGFSQLRNLSEYSQDRIQMDQTNFVLREKDIADFHWASEWTHTTAYAYPDKKAIFLWKFKDGSKAYSHPDDFLIGDLGKAMGYLVTGQSANLEDIHGRKIQPMTLSNYPVEFELWIGEIDDSTGYAPESLLDKVCFAEQSIRLNESNHFSDCK
jgi:hypothetical protein